jgi:predicted naringenin-chalcone synthase
MAAYIHTIEQSVPQYSYSQQELLQQMQNTIQGEEKERRLLHYIYNRSGIKTRHSVVNDFRHEGSFRLFFNGQGAKPGTKSRNDTFITEGRKLFVDVARRLISRSNFKPEEITHLITVSCTGFYAPGPDFDIVKALRMRPDIERYNLGFMGCYAVIPALKLANQICTADRNANVMIVSVELCTLHFQATPVTDDLVSASVFADGGAGAIVSSQKPETGSFFQIDGFASVITEKGEKDMAWSIGDNGFNMVLSSYIPSLLGSGLSDFLEPVLKKYSLAMEDVDLWGVHPGGRAILDTIEKNLNLPKDALTASRTILSRFGNMSSATILFVLRELLNADTDSGKSKTTMALAFGPGLTIESALLNKMRI